MSCVTSHRLAEIAVSLAILFLIALIASLSWLGSDVRVVSHTESEIIEKRALNGNSPDEIYKENSTAIAKRINQVAAFRNDNESELLFYLWGLVRMMMR